MFVNPLPQQHSTDDNGLTGSIPSEMLLLTGLSSCNLSKLFFVTWKPRLVYEPNSVLTISISLTLPGGNLFSDTSNAPTACLV